MRAFIQKKILRCLKIFFISIFIILLFYFLILENIFQQIESGKFSNTIYVKINLKTDIDIKLFRVTPRNNLKEILLNKNGSDFSGTVDGMYVSRIALIIKDEKEINNINSILVNANNKNFFNDNSSIIKNWEKTKNEKIILLSPVSLFNNESFLQKKFKVLKTINYPGDLTLFKFIILNNLERFIYFFLFLLLIFLINIYKNKLQDFYDNLLENKKYFKFIFFIFIILFTLIIRVQSFNHVIHVDEPTYLVVANNMIHGDILYVDTYDNKAPGLFLYYFIAVLFFNSLFWIRFLGSLLIAIIAIIIFFVVEKLFKLENVKYQLIPYFASFIYIILSCIHSWNYWINPEELIAFYSSLALLIILSNKKISVLLSSFILGLSFITKYSAGFDYLIFSVIWFIIQIKIYKNYKIDFYIKNIFLSIIAFIFPTIVIFLWYIFIGHINDLFNMLNNVLFNYGIKKTFSFFVLMSFTLVKEFHIFIILSIIGLIFIMKKKYNLILIILLSWTLSSLISIYSTGRPFLYYWFQIWPVVSILASFSFLFFKQFFIDKNNYNNLMIIFLLLIFIYLRIYNIERWNSKEDLFTIKDYLSDKLTAKDNFYVKKQPNNIGFQILYFLLNKKPPFKEVHEGQDLKTDLFNNNKLKYIINPPDEIKWKYLINKYYILDYNYKDCYIYKLKNQQVNY